MEISRRGLVKLLGGIVPAVAATKIAIPADDARKLEVLFVVDGKVIAKYEHGKSVIPGDKLCIKMDVDVQDWKEK